MEYLVYSYSDSSCGVYEFHYSCDSGEFLKDNDEVYGWKLQNKSKVYRGKGNTFEWKINEE